MTAPLLATSEALAAVLHEHRPIERRLLPPLLVSGCECGWGNEVFSHTAHLANALLTSGILRDPATLADDEALARAWDEGALAFSNGRGSDANPYRMWTR